jgi:purine nucleoside permease
LKGTTVTGDNYWKGEHGHNNAVSMVETYDCPDEYAITEMEDLAVAKAVRQMGLLDHFLIIRDSVNLDVFMGNATPESLWASESASKSLSSEDSEEAVDIFPTAMKNNFEVGRVVIDAVLNGELEMA